MITLKANRYFWRECLVRLSLSVTMSAVTLCTCVQQASAQNLADKTALGDAKATTIQKYGDLPLSFERFGDSEVVARGQGYALDIRGTQATIAVPIPGALRARVMEFVGARQVRAEVDGELPGKVNYVLGNDSRRWRLGLATYRRVTYPNVYPGIDLVYYGNQKQLEFDVVLKPGADVKSVKMRFSGSERPRMSSSGSLLLGDLKLVAPRVIQGGKTVMAGYQVLANGDVTFEVGAYDRGEALTIDPTIVYSTQMGGGNQNNRGNAIALDASGNTYIAGLTYADDFPAISSAFGGYSANGDGFVSKMNPTGTALIYSTYIGGSQYDSLQGIAVDATGAVWATGGSSSPDFPLVAAFQSAPGSSESAVVVKLTPSGALAYSTLLSGPSYAAGYSVAVDPFANAYVAGYATAGFPTTAGVYEKVIQGGAAGFVAKFSSSGALAWSTLLGGTNYDYASAIAVDEFGNSYVTGVSYSAAFPNAPPGGAQPINRGGGDVFIAKLNFNGTGLLYFTFLGGLGYDQPNAIAVDSVTGIATIAGQTTSTDLATSSGAVQPTSAGAYDGFVAKLNAAGSAFLYTTYLGGNRNDFVYGVVIDSAGNAYVAGSTDSNTFPVRSAIQNGMPGNSTSLFYSNSAGLSWNPIDANIPGVVQDVSPDPAAVGTIVVSTESGIYRTTNSGGTWTQQSAASYLRLARSPANPAVIYAFNCSSYQSTDSGLTWNYKGTTSPNCAYAAVADPLSPSTVYAYGASTVVVQKSVDNGVTWNPAYTGIPANQNVAKMVATSDGSLYVALRSALSGQDAMGIYKSADHGASWNAVNNGLSSNFPLGDLAAGPSNTVYVTDFFNLYVTTNGGASWSSTGSLPATFVGCIPNNLGVSGVNAALVYWAPCYFGWGSGPVAASTNAGASWTAGGGLGPATIYKIVGDPLGQGAAYALSSVNAAPFVAKIDAAGQNLLYSTYLGDSGGAYAIASNGSGDIFITGNTSSKAFPVTPLALQGDSPNPPPTEVFVTRISDTTSSCSFSVNPQQYLLGPYESTLQYSVVGPSGCAWSASSNQTWATVLSGSVGTGTGVVYVLLNENFTGATRSATLTIAGHAVTLSQLSPNCGTSFSIGSSTVPAGGGTLQLSVVTGAGCGWNVLNNDPNAITVVSGASGTGNGTVTLNVAPNLGPNTRTLNFLIQQGGSETISQAGTTAPAVVSTIISTPTGAAITVSGNGCIPGTYTTPASLTWNANTNCTVTFASPQNIAGSPYVFYSDSVNGGPSTTTNPLTVNSGSNPPTINASFLVPCSYSLSSSGQSFAASGGQGSFTVNTAATCSWTPVSSSGWITILPSGSRGTGKVNYLIAANSGASRNGTISAGGQQFTINQAALSCTYTISPPLAVFDYTGGTARVVVTTPAGCPWNATSNVAWMTLSAAGGTGTNAVVITATNALSAREGTVTIAGQTFTGVQNGVPPGGGGGGGGGANACGAVDVTSQVRVSLGGMQNIGTNLFHQEVTITNSSGSAINGGLYYVLIGLPSPSGAGLTTGPLTYCYSSAGSSIVAVSGGLANGQHVVFGMDFVSPPGTSLNYSYRVLSGQPSK